MLKAFHACLLHVVAIVFTVLWLSESVAAMTARVLLVAEWTQKTKLWGCEGTGPWLECQRGVRPLGACFHLPFPHFGLFLSQPLSLLLLSAKHQTLSLKCKALDVFVTHKSKLI